MRTMLIHRIMLLLPLLLLGPAGLLVAGWCRAVDGGSGISLLGGGRPLQAVLVMLLFAGLAGVIAAPSRSFAGPLGGRVVLGAAMGFVAVTGGSIDDWLLGYASRGTLGLLALESLLLAAWWLLAGCICDRLGRRPARSPEPSASNTGRMDQFASRFGRRIGAGEAAGRAIVALAVACLIGSILTALAVQSSDIRQVFGGLLLSWGVTAAVMRRAMPAAASTAVLLAPMVSAAVGYAILAIRMEDSATLIAAWHRGQLMHAALALPIHYASAGVLGVALGLRWSHLQIVQETESQGQ